MITSMDSVFVFVFRNDFHVYEDVLFFSVRINKKM